MSFYAQDDLTVRCLLGLIESPSGRNIHPHFLTYQADQTCAAIIAEK